MHCSDVNKPPKTTTKPAEYIDSALIIFILQYDDRLLNLLIKCEKRVNNGRWKIRVTSSNVFQCVQNPKYIEFIIMYFCIKKAKHPPV